MSEERIRPVTPIEIETRQREIEDQEFNSISNSLTESINELINTNYHQGYASVDLTKIATLLVDKGIDKKIIQRFNWWNIENITKIYGDAGWEIHYEDPDDSPSYYIFSRRQNLDEL